MAVVIIIPKDSITSLPPLPASHLVALSKLTPQAPGAGEGSLGCLSRCSLSLRTALWRGFLLWSSKFGSFLMSPFSWPQDPGPPPSTRENSTGTTDPQLEEDTRGSNGPFIACGLGTLACRFGETEKTSSFPRTVDPATPGHLPSPPESPSGGRGECLADPSSGELGQGFCLLKCYLGTSMQKEGQLVSIRSTEIGMKQTDNR